MKGINIKEKEDIKQIILNAAKKLFLEKGIEKTTIRTIATEINYSVGTIYVYYKDKKSILNDLHTSGFVKLGAEMGVLLAVSDPMERLKAMGRVYINFALNNPEMYELMFILKAPIEYLEETLCDDWNEGKATFNTLQITVKECLDNLHFKNHALEPLVFLIWSTVHGMCSLHVSHRSKTVNLHKPETIVMQAYEEFVKMIE